MKENLFADPGHEVFSKYSDAYTFYLWVYYFVQSILLVFSLITLRHILQGSRSRLAMKMVAGYIVFTITDMLKLIFFDPIMDVLDGSNPNYDWKIWLCVAGGDLCLVISDSSVSMIMWYFGYHYFNCGRKLGYFIRGEIVPASLDRNHRILFITGIVFAILLPTSYAVITTIQYYQQVKNIPNYMKWMIYVPYTGIGLLQAVSFTLLGSGVLRIRRLIVQNDSSEINNKKLLLHIICFALYLLTLCFLFYRTIYNAFAQVTDINNTIYWATLSQVVFFVMMTALLAILYSLGEKAQIDYSDSSSRVSTIQQQSPQSQRAGRLSMQKRLIERHELTATDLNSTLDVQEVEEDDRIINQFLLVRNKQSNSQTVQIDSSLRQFAY